MKWLVWFVPAVLCGPAVQLDAEKRTYTAKDVGIDFTYGADKKAVSLNSFINLYTTKTLIHGKSCEQAGVCFKESTTTFYDETGDKEVSTETTTINILGMPFKYVTGVYNLDWSVGKLTGQSEIRVVKSGDASVERPSSLGGVLGLGIGDKDQLLDKLFSGMESGSRTITLKQVEYVPPEYDEKGKVTKEMVRNGEVYFGEVPSSCKDVQYGDVVATNGKKSWLLQGQITVDGTVYKDKLIAFDPVVGDRVPRDVYDKVLPSTAKEVEDVKELEVTLNGVPHRFTKDQLARKVNDKLEGLISTSGANDPADYVLGPSFMRTNCIVLKKEEAGGYQIGIGKNGSLKTAALTTATLLLTMLNVLRL